MEYSPIPLPEPYRIKAVDTKKRMPAGSPESTLSLPYKITMTEPIVLIPASEREQAIKEAGYNTFLLKARHVFIDLLTDSGTSAMSEEQWERMRHADETYAGAESFYRFEETVREFYGFKNIIPTHQGRAAEHLLAKTLITPGQYALKNMYFTTTRQHIELAGGIFKDVIIPEAHDPAIVLPFKGNVDLQAVEDHIKKEGVSSVALFWIETCVNMAGGQPISMENLKGLREISLKYNIPLYLDATRALENAYFIKQREPGYGDRSVKSILKEIMSYADGCTMSSKKDNLVNIGGFLATNDDTIVPDVEDLLTTYEGLGTYGGMAGYSMEALAQGILEMVEEDYIAHRIGQVQKFGEYFIKENIPIVHPIGGHAVVLDAGKILSGLDQERFPAQSLVAAIYQHTGVRAMERGIVSAGRDPETQENRKPDLETLRLTVSRRVYLDSHLEYAANSIIDLLENHLDNPIFSKGLEFVYEPKKLRFFGAKFKIAD